MNEWCFRHILAKIGPFKKTVKGNIHYVCFPRQNQRYKIATYYYKIIAAADPEEGGGSGGCRPLRFQNKIASTSIKLANTPKIY